MLSRERVWEALAQAWQDKVGSVHTGGFNAQADALLALLPTAEEIGHAACEVMQPRGGRIVGSYREIGTAILEELGKEGK